MIIRGKDKGETGLIKRVIRSQNRVIVEGKNLVIYCTYMFFPSCLACVDPQITVCGYIGLIPFA